MKGIILAGGSGTRLWPMTAQISKQLLPIYDKPLIYYPVATLMLAGIREILIITTPEDNLNFKKLLGNGEQFGVTFEFRVQEKPEGLAQALIIGDEFLNYEPCMMILGDNVFHGEGMGTQLRNLANHQKGAHIFTYAVANPSNYGVVEFNDDGTIYKLTEKPIDTASNLAITGLYIFDSKAPEIARQVKPSARGELEIISVLEKYNQFNELQVTNFNRGTAWLDTGTVDDMNNASNYVRVIEDRTGLKVACLEEIALNNNWVSTEEMRERIKIIRGGSYLDYVRKLVI